MLYRFWVYFGFGSHHNPPKHKRSYLTVTIIHDAPSQTASLSIEPQEIISGQSATMTWTCGEADTCTIEPGIGQVNPSGSTAVSPTESTTYILTATNATGSATASTTLTVHEPPTAQITADPKTIMAGQSAALSWSTAHADTIRINPGIGSVAANGSTTVSPSETTIYTITASGLGGTVSANASVAVTNPTPTVTINATPTTIARGESLTLTWSSTHADSCVIVPDIGAVPVSGSRTVSPDQDTTYVITASGSGDTATAQIAVTILSSLPTVNLKASPHTITSGESTTLNWSSEFATSAVIDHGIGPVPVNGSVSIAPTATTTYTLTVTGPGGTAAASAAVNVTVPTPTANITAEPASIMAENSTTLTWASTHASSVTLEPGIGDVAASGSISVSPAETTTYTLVAENSAGVVTSNATVLVSPVPTAQITVDPKTIRTGESATLSWNTAHAETVMIEPSIGSVGLSGSQTVTPADTTIYIITATGPGGSVTSSTTLSVIDATAPPIVHFFPASITVASGESTVLTWTSSGATSAYIDNGVGAVATSDSVTVTPEHTTIFTLTVTGPTGSASAQAEVYVTAYTEPQPEGTFGHLYNDQIPADATIGYYDEKRFALIVGTVVDSESQPIESVSVTTHNHPEYGTVITDAQGKFSLPVQGGALMTVVYRKQGLITSHRQVNVPWNDFAIADTVTMLAEDSASSSVTFDSNPDTVVTHRSTPYTDEFGTRSATLVFTGDNQAYLTDKDGNAIQALNTISTRATVYSTPESMPAVLPPNSGFTYCVELAVDGAQRVKFNKPVTTWVENYLGFDVGEIVPVGYYDRDRSVWVPSDNGTVVRLLDTDADGFVDAMDADGDDQPDDLNADGSYSDEVNGLSDPASYAPGATFWRVQVTHFTPWDCNWPFGPPLDATQPNPPSDPQADEKMEEGNECKVPYNSFVEERSRIFHEDIPIAGTNMMLHYASNRVDGYQTAISVPASGETIPDSLKEIIVEAEIAGRTFAKKLAPLPNQKAEFYWDGLDYLGNEIRGVAIAHIRLGFVYDAFYYSAGANFIRSFAQTGENVTGIIAEQEIISWKTNKIKFTRGGGASSIAKGWTLSSHHQLNQNTNSIFLQKGDGGLIKNALGIMTTEAGSGESYSIDSGKYGGDNGLAVDAWFRSPRSVSMDASGNLYIADTGNSRIRMVDHFGIITTVAGNGDKSSYGYNGDDIPAVQAQLYHPAGVAADASGNFYIADTGNNRIRMVDKSGVITTIAGTGTQGYSGDDGPAIQAQLYGPSAVAIDASGNLYIVDTGNNRIRKVDPSGVISTIAGTGMEGYNGDGGSAVQAWLYFPTDAAMDDSGNLYIADSRNNRIRKVDPNGIITTLAGNGSYGYSGDGGSATQAKLSEPKGVLFDPSGNLYIADSGNNSIRKVDSSGVIITVSGNGTRCSFYGDGIYCGDGGTTAQAMLSEVWNMAIDPIGNLYIADSGNHRIRKVAPPLRVFTNATIQGQFAFVEQSGLGHVIGASGQHESTIDINTGVVLLAFSYDQQDELVSIMDQFENEIIIERSGAQIPTAIVSPDGLRTELFIDNDNHLVQITYPDGGNYDFEYTTDGLLTNKIDPNRNNFRNVFDSIGRLVSISDDEGGLWQYSRTHNTVSDFLIEKISAEGNLTTYLDHTNSTGAYTSTITDPTGTQTLYSRSADGLSAQRTLGCGMSLAFKYDVDSLYQFGYVKQTTETTPSGLEKTTTLERIYEDTNIDELPDQITELVTMNGKDTTIFTNTLQTSKVVTSPEGRTVTTLYEPTTLLNTSISIPGLYETNIGYDTNGRVTSTTTNTRETIFTYDNLGNLDSILDAENNTTSYGYDAVGRVSSINRPDGSSLRFAYDPNGNMTILTNPVDVDHISTFNQVNLPSGYQTPISGNYSYIYDNDRQLIQTNFPSGKQINNVYTDTQLTQIQTPEGNIDLSYSCSSKLESITKDGETIEYAYDGKLPTDITLSGTLNQNLNYAYNDDFEVIAATYAGETETYSYDLDGLLTGANGFNISRNIQNGLPENVSGIGLNIDRTYNGYGERETQNVTVNAQPAIQWTLTRDNVGRITSKTETVYSVANTYDYTYDSMGRLQTVTLNGTLVEDYSYDLSGTRISETNTRRGIVNRSFSYSDEDHLLTAGDSVFTYDLDGFLNTKTSAGHITTYSYSSRGELLQVELPDGRTVDYLHDPMGRRIAKRVDGAIVEKYLWQDLTKLLAVFDGSDSLIQRFIYADGRTPVAMTMEGVRYLLGYDQVGSLRIVIDGSGNIVKRIDYDSYGNILDDSNPSFAIPLGFAGGLHDRDTGLVRFGYRDFETDTGRWTAKDPIRFAGGDTDLYGYCFNDPINFIDPIGLESYWERFKKWWDRADNAKEFAKEVKNANSRAESYKNAYQELVDIGQGKSMACPAQAAEKVLTEADEMIKQTAKAVGAGGRVEGTLTGSKGIKPIK